MDSAAVVHNLGLGGVCLETKRFYEPGRVMRLEFTLPFHGTLATFAEVCWTDGFRMGMRFLAVPEKGTQDLKQYILSERVSGQQDVEGRGGS